MGNSLKRQGVAAGSSFFSVLPCRRTAYKGVLENRSLLFRDRYSIRTLNGAMPPVKTVFGTSPEPQIVNESIPQTPKVLQRNLTLLDARKNRVPGQAAED
jgi:hypothetical protein